MKRITNEKIKKELKKINNNLIIGIVCIVLACTCFALAYYLDNKEPEKSTYLNDLIESTDADRTDLDANLKLTRKPVKFAKMSGSSSKKLYIATDEEFFYIIALTDSNYKEITKNDLEKNPVTIYGKTKTITSDIKALAESYYNDVVDEEYRISGDKAFYDKFGDLYLDTTENNEASTILYVIGALCQLCGIVSLIVFGVIKYKVGKTLKAFDDEELKKIEMEIDEKESFHYEKAHLILTPNYVVSFLNGLTILRYEDIIWVYEYRLRQYGITTQKSIMVMNKLGKVKPIITLDGVTKKSKMVFEEIADTILSKNNKIIVGYNRDNRKRIKDEYGF